MNLSDVTTLKDVSEKYEISISTLKTRLTLKSYGMVEGKDFRRMGKGQGILLSPEGVNKIVKKPKQK